MAKIHEKSLYILEKVGIKIPHQKCLDALAETEAKIDFGSQKVTFPKTLVEDCLEKVPKHLLMAARNAKFDIVIPHPEQDFYTRTAIGQSGFIDSETGSFRPTTINDQAEWACVTDALDHINCCANLSPQDVPQAAISIHAVKAMIENTEKHLMLQAFSAESLEYLAQMAVAVMGSKEELAKRPILHWSCCALTPLSYKSMDLEALWVAAKYNLPIKISSLPSAGGTAPVTLPGVLLLTNVELLGGVVLSQVVKPGLPIIHNALHYAIDMATGNIIHSSPEAILASAASVQLTKELYGIPSMALGMGTDAIGLDGQGMFERGMMGLVVAMAGADMLAGAGEVECCLTGSLLQLIIDNDLHGMTHKMMKTIDVNEDTLAWEAIAQVGPEGNFLTHDHTVRHCREAFRPRTFVRKPRSLWESEGCKGILEMAKERLDEIRKKHQPTPLSKEVQKELVEIVREADKRLAGKG
jgi:trimethylamine:corrinoid methyltransferase-like protein